MWAPSEEIERLVADRMEHLGLRNEANAVTISIGVIRDWIRTKQGDITIDVLERVLRERDLYVPQSAERCVTIHMNTIGERLFDLQSGLCSRLAEVLRGRMVKILGCTEK